MALYCETANHRTLQPFIPPTGKPPARPYRANLNVQVQAEIHFDNYDFDLALAVYHEQASLFGGNPKVLFNIGQIHLLLGERYEASAWFRRATVADPYMAVAFFQLAGCYAALHKFDQAYEEYVSCLNTVVRGEEEEGEEGPNMNIVEYDQLGMRYSLSAQDIRGNIRLCTGVKKPEDLAKNLRGCRRERIQLDLKEEVWSGARERRDIPRRLVTVPAGTIFRVPEKKARARGADPAKTAVWRFRDEARVVAQA